MTKATYSELKAKWSSVLNEEAAGEIRDDYRKSVTARLLENQEEVSMLEQEAVNYLAEDGQNNTTAVTGAGTANWNPVLMALVRRAMPNMMAYDLASVQPMTGPTGLVFCMKSKYKTTKAGVSAGDEALFNEPAIGYAADSSTTANGGTSGLAGLTDDSSTGLRTVDSSIDDSRTGPVLPDRYSTVEMEGLGATGNEAFAEMGFTIDKATVTAEGLALKADYTIEMAQDLKAIHGLEAERELANILTSEILGEINRTVVRTINSQAKTGCLQANTAINGIFDLSTDADGRWSVEKIKGLILQIERECNVIAKETRRGKGNIAVVSSDVASALAASGMLDYAPAMSTQLNVDDTGNTFAGVLNKKIKIYVDPYADVDYITVGYKGSSAYDAGVFYCPYVPLTMVRAVGENDFQPRIGFKTRYGMVSNPFVGDTPANGLAAAKTNQYYRIFRVDNLLAS